MRIRRDQAAWKERPLAVESIESAFLTGLGTAAEAAFEVQPIGYEWARAELVEPARVALIPIHLQAENRSKTSPFITPSRAKFALRHPIISQMAQTRILSGKAVDDAEERFNWSLRPRRLDEYIGQPNLIEKLRIAIQAARMRQDPMEHTLLHGPPGLGKTTLAHVIANEMGTKLHISSGPALTRAGDLVGILTKLQPGDVLFIDEIHRLPAAVEEYIYPAIEDFQIDVPVDSGMHARSITLPLKPFTLIGATTRAGLVSGPMRSRFGIAHHLEYYGEDELFIIAKRSSELLEMIVEDDEALRALARRSRGTPRIVNRLLRRVRDYAMVKNAGRVTNDLVNETLQLEGVDELGLDQHDRSYLKVIATTYHGGPVGLEAVAATLNEDPGTLEDVVEPYLLQLGFLARTRRGRQLTPPGARYIGVHSKAAAEGTLFTDDPDA